MLSNDRRHVKPPSRQTDTSKRYRSCVRTTLCSNGQIPFNMPTVVVSHGKVQMLADGPKSRRGSIEKLVLNELALTRETNSKSANKRDSRVRMPQVVASATVTRGGGVGCVVERAGDAKRDELHRVGGHARPSACWCSPPRLVACGCASLGTAPRGGVRLAVGRGRGWRGDLHRTRAHRRDRGRARPRGDARERVHGHARGAFGPVVPRLDRRTLRRRRVRG